MTDVRIWRNKKALIYAVEGIVTTEGLKVDEGYNELIFSEPNLKIGDIVSATFHINDDIILVEKCRIGYVAKRKKRFLHDKSLIGRDSKEKFFFRDLYSVVIEFLSEKKVL